MIVVEYFQTTVNGDILNRTYSDSGYMIEREGVLYSEAIDLAKLNRQYTETNEALKETMVFEKGVI